VNTHRTRAWTSAETRAVIIDACYSLIEEAAVSPSTPFPEISVASVTQVANAIWAQRFPDFRRELGRGAVASNFPGGQSRLILETIREKIAPALIQDAVSGFEEALRTGERLPLPDRHEFLLEAHRELVIADVTHVMDVRETSTYLRLLAHHWDNEVQAVVAKIYDGFDAMLIPLYERFLGLLGLRLKDAYSVEQFAAGFTAITEGLGIRSVVHHPMQDEEQKASLKAVAAAAARGLIATMTEPAGD
jgi:AcrR family transcriptional regulator